jgi:hypothetical protein
MLCVLLHAAHPDTEDEKLLEEELNTPSDSKR